MRESFYTAVNYVCGFLAIVNQIIFLYKLLVFSLQTFGSGPHTEQQKEEMKNLQVILSKAKQENLKVREMVFVVIINDEAKLWQP